MHILHLLGDMKLPSRPSAQAASGVVNATLALARAQARLQHDVWVASIGRVAWASQWEGVKLLQLKQAGWAQLELGTFKLDLRTHLPYVWLTHRYPFDVVQGSTHYYLRFLKARTRVAHFHTDPMHRGEGARSVALSAADFSLIARFSDAQVAVSRYVAAQLEQGLGMAGKVSVVYNGVDSGRFDQRRWQSERHGLRAAWGADASDTVFLYAGAVVPEKGVLHLACAFRRLAEACPGAHLVVAGGSELWAQNLMHHDPASSYDAQVRAELARIDPARVHLLGKVETERMPAICAACDVVVVPSVWNDPFPLVALEALATERPVIASNVGGLPESVNEANGILVPPGDDTALYEAMRRLATQAERRRELGSGARKQAARFSWDTAAQAFDAIYAAKPGWGGQV